MLCPNHPYLVAGTFLCWCGCSLWRRSRQMPSYRGALAHSRSPTPTGSPKPSPTICSAGRRRTRRWCGSWLRRRPGPHSGRVCLSMPTESRRSCSPTGMSSATAGRPCSCSFPTGFRPPAPSSAGTRHGTWRRWSSGSHRRHRFPSQPRPPRPATCSQSPATAADPIAPRPAAAPSISHRGRATRRSSLNCRPGPGRATRADRFSTNAANSPACSSVRTMATRSAVVPRGCARSWPALARAVLPPRRPPPTPMPGRSTTAGVEPNMPHGSGWLRPRSTVPVSSRSPWHLQHRAPTPPHCSRRRSSLTMEPCLRMPHHSPPVACSRPLSRAGYPLRSACPPGTNWLPSSTSPPTARRCCRPSAASP